MFGMRDFLQHLLVQVVTDARHGPVISSREPMNGKWKRRRSKLPPPKGLMALRGDILAWSSGGEQAAESVQVLRFGSRSRLTIEGEPGSR